MRCGNGLLEEINLLGNLLDDTTSGIEGNK
jgi:hypothetical protein